jgi:hypothetical protein
MLGGHHHLLVVLRRQGLPVLHWQREGNHSEVAADG